MSIGFGIFLVAVGAILSFAVTATVEGVDLVLVGYILMISGVVTTVIGLILMARRRSASSSEQTTVDPASGNRTTRRESSASDPVE